MPAERKTKEKKKYDEESFDERVQKMKKQAEQEYKVLYRSGKNKILGGVCGGIGEYLNTDPAVIRLVWIAGILVSIGIAIILYIIAWIIIPRNPKHEWED